MTSVGIVGLGIVGKAVADGMKELGNEVYVNDIRPIPEGYTPITTYDMVNLCEVIFICVPTPQREDGGCDLSTIYQVHGQISIDIARAINNGLTDPPILVIKSTVLPGTCEMLIQGYRYTCSNPEFLRQSHAQDDFKNPDRTVIGTENPRIQKVMQELYKDVTGERMICSPTAAELIKYFSNVALIMKVALSQEIKRVSELHKQDPFPVAIGVGYDKRIKLSHLDPTKGKIDPDSPCLPKDINALIQHLAIKGYNTEFLKMIREKGVNRSYKRQLSQVEGLDEAKQYEIDRILREMEDYDL